jgi:succinoglycan biosynthesis transport protein ExoP
MKSIVAVRDQPGAQGKAAQSLREEIRHLWSRLRMSLGSRSEASKTVAVCGTFPGEGTTSVAANFALFLAEQGRSACLVESNLRHPCLAEHFAVPESPGLAEFMEGTAHLEEILRENVVPGVHLVPAGHAPSDRYGLFGNGGFVRFLEEGNELCDVMVLDVPPLSQAPEALMVLKTADLALLVVEAHRTRRQAVQRSVATLEEIGVVLGGVVLNQVRHDIPAFLDGLL